MVSLRFRVISIRFGLGLGGVKVLNRRPDHKKWGCISRNIRQSTKRPTNGPSQSVSHRPGSRRKAKNYGEIHPLSMMFPIERQMGHHQSTSEPEIVVPIYIYTIRG